MKSALLILVLFGTLYGSQALSCGECNHSNTTETCGAPPTCEQTVLDACGCCPLCAKLVGDTCGGPWDSLGSCADGLTCHPLTSDPPRLGAGGFFSETWDPPGICVNPRDYEREHSQCLELLRTYQQFSKSRTRRSADATTNATTSTVATADGVTTNDVTADDVTTDDVTTTTTAQPETETTTMPCVRKPSCTPDGKFTPLQCDGCSGECWCVLYDGEEIKGSRGPYRSVRC